MISRKGQIWVETVIYTLIGLALIGMVLAFATPKINESKENLVIEQTIESLNIFDDKINSVLQVSGNIREIPFTMQRGDLYINSSEDKIVFVLEDLTNLYSEPGTEIDYGRIKILSEEEGDERSVSLTLDYTGIVDIEFEEEEVDKKFTAATTPYRFSVWNKGSGVVSISEFSGG